MGGDSSLECDQKGVGLVDLGTNGLGFRLGGDSSLECNQKGVGLVDLGTNGLGFRD